MAQLEETVSILLGGEQHKCAFVRSKDFITLRLQALYHRSVASTFPLMVYGEGLKISLDAENNATVYLVGPSILESDESLVRPGKRGCTDPDGPGAFDETE